MWKGARNRRLRAPPPPPIVFSFDPGSVFERHPLLYESQTNNTQSPPMPVTQSKNINSDIRFWPIITLENTATEPPFVSWGIGWRISQVDGFHFNRFTWKHALFNGNWFLLVNEFFGEPTSQSSCTATISLLENNHKQELTVCQWISTFFVHQYLELRGWKFRNIYINKIKWEMRI